ncbi:MAG TPA: aldo/keto reductase [Xanthomonadaceae bacterium]|nr:aldo/keto reductase [Xanthomonadaceae bacterium]
MATRRQFLSDSAWSAAALALTPLAACSQEPTPPKAPAAAPAPTAPASAAKASGPLLMRKIPATGEAIPAIGVGTSGSYEVPPDSPEFTALKDVLRTFFDGGGRVIDTSPNYSNAEDIVGALLKQGGWRERCFLATKLAADDRATLERQWADSQRRLQTEKVELLQVHNLRNMEQAWPYARELKEAGATKYIGLTHYVERGHADLARYMREHKPDFVQINYSVAAPQAAKTIFPIAQELGIAVMVNRAFDDGNLFQAVRDRPLPGWAAEAQIGSWAQLFLRFVLSHPAVTVVIPATGKPERQADNLKGGIGPLLNQAQQDELVKMFA